MNNATNATNAILAVIFIFLPIIAWITHVFYCFQQEAWGFLIAGALFFPVAIIHGVYLWFT